MSDREREIRGQRLTAMVAQVLDADVNPNFTQWDDVFVSELAGRARTLLADVSRLREERDECCAIYWCPTAGEMECSRHGGFDTCCEHPELHVPAESVAAGLRDALREAQEILEGWTDPVIDNYEERCDRVRVVVSEALAASPVSSSTGTGAGT